MTDLSVAQKLSPYKPKNKVRFVTAASLFDGHDASINIMRRILQSTGAEVIHLGHNRSVQEIVNAALQEDVQGICITSYQGGHVEFFKYMIDLLQGQRRRQHQGLRRRRRRHRAGRNQGAARLRRDPHLCAGRRRAHGPAGHDQRGGAAVRLRSGAARACQLPNRFWLVCRAGDKRLLARLITAARKRCGTGPEGAAAQGCRRTDGAGARHHRHRRRRQVLADRRTGPPLPPRPGR